MGAPIDLTGQRFGLLVARCRVANHRGQTTWLCDCDCGGTREARLSRLRSGEMKTCGCHRDPFRRVMENSTVEPSGCRVFNGTRDVKGYGVLKVGRDKMRRAHRVAWEAHFGPIPEGLFVCHHCDNPPCVDIGHLFLGTHRDNMADMIRKGRADNQIANPHNAKLNPAAVLEIRARADEGEPYDVIGADFGVTAENIYRIVRGKSWAHVVAP